VFSIFCKEMGRKGYLEVFGVGDRFSAARLVPPGQDLSRPKPVKGVHTKPKAETHKHREPKAEAFPPTFQFPTHPSGRCASGALNVILTVHFEKFANAVGR